LTGSRFSGVNPAETKHAKMMRLGEPLAVSIVAPAGKRAPGEGRLQRWSPRARTLRGLRFLAFCWAMSVLCVLIPLAHFVLVPGFFIAGPIGAWRLSRQDRIILGGEGICPACAALLVIVRGPDRWPRPDLCTRCQTAVTIERA